MSLSITPSYILSAVGSITLSLPEYYTGSGSDYMIDPSVLSCSAQTSITITRCEFDTGQRTVKWTYEFKNGASSKQTNMFYLDSCFKNPITPEQKTGFIIASFDSQDYSIGETQSVALDGITEPNTFEYINFNFDQGSNVVGELNKL